MISIPILDAEAKPVGAMDVDEARLGSTVHRQALREAIIMHQARARVGTASCQTRSHVTGSGRKPYRQKGTGRARAGSFKSPLWRSGGVAFGPHPRDYSYSIPKKVRRRAIQSALLAKIQDGEVIVVDALTVEQPQTKQIVSLLRALGVHGTCLIVVPELDRNVHLSARNIPGVDVLPASNLNAYDLVVKSRVLMTQAALERVLGGK